MNEVQRYMATKAVAADESSVTQQAGSAMIKTGVGALGIYAVAALLPFVSFLPLLLVVMVLGGYLVVKR